MKVLLLTPDHPPSYTDALYLALRARVGTCDFYPLDGRQSGNMEDFFRRHIRLAHFDRILLMFDAPLIYEQSPFLRHLPTLACLAIETPADEQLEHRRMLNNFKTMPWMRWIGTDIERCHEYQDLGYDAYWIPPVFDNNLFQYHHRQRQELSCHVYTMPGQQAAIREALPAGLKVHFIEPENRYDMVGQIQPEDLFIYWPEANEKKITPLIQAMACGAVAITRDLGLEKRVLYGWRGDYDMLFVNGLGELGERVAPLLQYPHRRRELAEHAAQKVKLFYPSSVGRRIGIHMEVPVRNPNHYPMKQRIFGFEI